MTQILNATEIDQKIQRLAWQIYENHIHEKQIVLAGIHKNGYILAKEIYDILSNISKQEISLISVVVNKKNPLSEEVKLDSEIDLNGQCVVLVDDVLNSGKTLIYGVNFFLTYTLKKLTTAVLVDRNHKRFPIKADVKGLSLSTSLQENVKVVFGEKGGVFLS
jgi:pyrimidine operon attenuation protein/uracil phosphoribosyltransferase